MGRARPRANGLSREPIPVSYGFVGLIRTTRTAAARAAARSLAISSPARSRAARSRAVPHFFPQPLDDTPPPLHPVALFCSHRAPSRLQINGPNSGYEGQTRPHQPGRRRLAQNLPLR